MYGSGGFLFFSGPPSEGSDGGWKKFFSDGIGVEVAVDSTGASFSGGFVIKPPPTFCGLIPSPFGSNSGTLLRSSRVVDLVVVRFGTGGKIFGCWRFLENFLGIL